MDRHTESLIYTKCPKTLRDKKESTPSSVSQPPRSIRSRPDPIDPTPRARRSRARARTRREDRPRIERAKKQSDRVARRPLARVVASRRRRRAAVRQSPTRRPAKPRASVRASKTPSHFTSHDPSNPTHTRGFGCRANDRARDAERTSPTTDGRRTTRRWFPTDRARTNGARVASIDRTSSSQPSWRTP